MLLRKNKARVLKNPNILRGLISGEAIKKIGTRAPLNHVIYSGCKDNETSADAFIDGKWQGAFTAKRRKKVSNTKKWADIHLDVQSATKEFNQTPQLNGRELNTRLIFGGN